MRILWHTCGAGETTDLPSMVGAVTGDPGRAPLSTRAERGQHAPPEPGTDSRPTEQREPGQTRPALLDTPNLTGAPTLLMTPNLLIRSRDVRHQPHLTL